MTRRTFVGMSTPLVLILAAMAFWPKGASMDCNTAPVLTPTGQEIIVEIARSRLQRARGLSNRDILEPHHGMLFLFDTTETHAFWMKDTRIPLDIIWMNNYTVVDQTTLPAEKPGSPVPQYTPKFPANSVLELNAGEASKLGFYTGKTVTLPKNSCLTRP